MSCLNRASTLDDSDEDGDYRQHQQDVNESAEGVGTHHPQQPQNQQEGSNSSTASDVIPFNQAIESSCIDEPMRGKKWSLSGKVLNLPSDAL